MYLIKKYGIRGLPLLWFKSYLHGITQYVSFNGVLSDYSCRHHAPEIWNLLPTNITSISFYNSFKRSLKRFLIAHDSHWMYLSSSLPFSLSLSLSFFLPLCYLLTFSSYHVVLYVLGLCRLLCNFWMILSETLLATFFLCYIYYILFDRKLSRQNLFLVFFLQLCFTLFCINSFHMYMLSQFMYYILHEIECFYFVMFF